MATTVRYPSSNNQGWSYSSWAYSNDSLYATSAPSPANTDDTVTYGNFGFDSIIPGGSTINSVTIEVEWRVSTTISVATLLVDALVNNVATGTQYSNATEPTSDTISSYVNDYGSWTRADLLNGVFLVKLTCSRGTGKEGFTMYLDYVKVTVDYTVTNTSPTTTLGNPIDTAIDVSVNPTLAFTGTDAESNAVDYNVQIDSANTFDDHLVAGTNIGLPALYRLGSLSNSGYTWILIDNPVMESGKLTSIDTWAYTDLSNLKVGTFYGSGTSWTSRDYAYIGSVTAGSMQTFSGLNITAEIGDHIGLYFDGGYIRYNTSGYNGRFQSTTIGDKFGAGTQTYNYYQSYGISLEGHISISGPLISAFSTNHTGFSAGESHPTASGVEQTYTVQVSESIDNSTEYFWRARAADPSGTTFYGSWSTTKSFTTIKGEGIKAWNGTVWVYKPAKVWNGSDWVEKPVNVWDGSSWVERS